MNKFKVLLFFLFVGFTITAQVKKWTLQECVAHALENNISIKQAQLDVESSEIAKSDAIGNYLPSLNASAGNSWNTGLTQDVTTGVLRTQTSRNSSYGITASITVFNGLRNLREAQRAKISNLASRYNLKKMEDDITLFVANSYLQVLFNKANLEVIKSQNEVTSEQIIRTNELVESGVLPRGDLLEIRATDANEKQQIVVAENNVKISLISLAQLLAMQSYEDFDIADDEYSIIGGDFLLKDVSEIIESAKNSRTEVKIAEQNVLLAMNFLKITRANYYPTVSAFFNYNTRESGSNRFVQTVDPVNPTITTQIGVVEATGQSVIATTPNFIIQELPPLPYFDQLYLNDGVSYGLQLNIPVFNGFSTRNSVKRSKIDVKRTQFQLEQARLDLESNVYQAYVDAKGALKAYESSELALESQELAYQYAKDRYDVGLTNAFDFSQSKLRYDNAKIEVNRAKYDYIFKLKVLELYFGISATELKF